MTPLRLYACFIALLFICSCNMEKRLYRGGYYISSASRVKSIPVKKTYTAPLTDTAFEKNENQALYAETDTLQSVEAASYLPRKGMILTTQSIKQPSTVTYTNENTTHGRPENTIPRDDKVKKDVKQLFAGSLFCLFLSSLLWLFGLFAAPATISLLFLLTLFSIFGLWIYGLLLYTKYSAEDRQNNPEKKPGADRIITQRKAFLFAGFLGMFGVHRFYLGYTSMGILEMLTFGGFLVLYFIDLIRIREGKLKPKNKDYDKGYSTYEKSNKNKAANRSKKLIQMAFLISLLAAALLLAFAIFG